MKYFGDIYTMVRNMGVMDDRTGLSYSQLNLTDEVAEWLLKNKPTYEDRILTIEDYEKLGRPTYDGLQTLRLMGLYPIPDDVPRGTIPEVEPDVKPEVEPDVEPEVEPEVEPDVEPEVEPDVPRGTSDDDELTDSKTDENETDNGNN